MRIISGKYGKRRFSPPRNFKGRPTTDMAKEGLFNILQNLIDWEETIVLDLFAGTGSIGIECLSRGAREVMAIEKDPRHVAFIKKVIEELNDPNYQVQTRDVLKYLQDQTDRTSKEQYDLIFADPPYNLAALGELPDRIIESNILEPEGILVIEHPRDISFTEHQRHDYTRNYGSVHFSFFR